MIAKNTVCLWFDKDGNRFDLIERSART
jgi:hypothetical protein